MHKSNLELNSAMKMEYGRTRAVIRFSRFMRIETSAACADRSRRIDDCPLAASEELLMFLAVVNDLRRTNSCDRASVTSMGTHSSHLHKILNCRRRGIFQQPADNANEKKQAGIHVDSDIAGNPDFAERTNASISALSLYGLHLPLWLSQGHSSQLKASNLLNKPAST